MVFDNAVLTDTRHRYIYKYIHILPLEYILPLPVPFLPRTLGVFAADGRRCCALRRADVDVFILIGLVSFI